MPPEVLLSSVRHGNGQLMDAEDRDPIMADKVTLPALLQMKREGRKSAGVVAWDFQIARIADRAGVDFVSVGRLGRRQLVGA